ncbi:hypothetical protein ACTMTI_53060 [Nonomuraea sp. H19]|uniref:hypothetical protein n=1 Tax=Nonomuraea sp. H19 TaxID=3452206 RepID=UPI003F8B4CAF
MTDAASAPDESAGNPAQPGDVPGSGWFSPGVAGMGGASLLADVGHEVPSALLPSLLTPAHGAAGATMIALALYAAYKLVSRSVRLSRQRAHSTRSAPGA